MASKSLLLSVLLIGLVQQSIQADLLTCPFTGKQPTKPTTLPRCVRYQESSCCDSCLDWSTAATVVSVNGSYVASTLFPPGFNFPGIDKFKNATFCSFVAGADDCLQELEVIYCAVMCAPDGQRFMKISPDGKNGTMYMCDSYAQVVFDKCKGLSLLGLPTTIGQLVPNPSIFASAIVGQLAGTATPLDKLSVVVTPSTASNDTCFASASAEPVPATPLCCDELSGFPTKCFDEYPKTPHVGINRPIAPSCHAPPPATSPPSPPPAPPKGAAAGGRMGAGVAATVAGAVLALFLMAL